MAAGSAAAARRYAKALFRIASEDDTLAATRAELGALDDLLADNEALRDALFRPLHPGAERRQVVRAVADKLGASEMLQRFCGFLVDQRRLVDFAAIRAEFDRLASESEGRTEARITSAKPLDEATRERLVRALSARTGREVTATVEIDPDLIGGVVAQVGDLVFDGSLRTQLQQLRTNLTKD